jgi:hypothetical protein
MSLSDTCFDAIAELNRGFRRNLNRSYSIETMNKIASTILELADLAYTLNHTSRIAAGYEELYGVPKPVRLIAECVVIGDLIVGPDRYTADGAALEAVAQIAAMNPSIRSAIINAYNWQQSQAGIAELLRNADIISVTPIYQHITA